MKSNGNDKKEWIVRKFHAQVKVTFVLLFLFQEVPMILTAKNGNTLQART